MIRSIVEWLAHAGCNRAAHASFSNMKETQSHAAFTAAWPFNRLTHMPALAYVVLDSLVHRR